MPIPATNQRFTARLIKGAAITSVICTAGGCQSVHGRASAYERHHGKPDVYYEEAGDAGRWTAADDPSRATDWWPSPHEVTLFYLKENRIVRVQEGQRTEELTMPEIEWLAHSVEAASDVHKRWEDREN